MRLSICTFISLAVFHTALANCPTFPKDAHSSEVNVSLIGTPQHFVPLSRYTVAVQSKSFFTEFIITAESEGNEGSFQILNDGVSSFSEECLNTVANIDEKEKNKIWVLWTSPVNGCVKIRGAVKIKGAWHENVKDICVLPGAQNKPRGVTKCCACDHAKYKAIFKGIWSPETHPKDFPTVLTFTHFSDVIGATHSPNFTMWEEGKIASYGFQQLAEYGIVREMEVELRNQSSKLRSIIKAAGLWYPNVNGNTTAVFRVDPRRYLLSLASMFGPSPDWIVGVSGLNLCNENCTWVDNMEIDLYPYDAGTDDGISYMSPSISTVPQGKIHRITSTYPEDDRSPFYDPSGKEVPTLAKLFIKLEKTVAKKCSDLTDDEIIEQVSLSENTEETFRGECAVTPYSDWSPCSVTCGKGLRMRKRQYVSPEKAALFECNRQLVSKEMCIENDGFCPGDEDDDIDPKPLHALGECDVTDWTDWSDCSVTCGIGFMVRTRSLLSSDRALIKRCMDISTMEKKKCMLPVCTSQNAQVPLKCNLSDWSEWSVCSVTCGNGVRSRIRSLNQKPSIYCKGVSLREERECSTKVSCQIDHAQAREICQLPPVAGPCRSEFKRWAYNHKSGECEEFEYGGCRGNKNNFENKIDCEMACSGVAPEEEQKPVSCLVSQWSPWSPCSPCPSGKKTKIRTVIRKPENGGRPCPSIVRTMKCTVPAEFCGS